MQPYRLPVCDQNPHDPTWKDALIGIALLTLFAGVLFGIAVFCVGCDKVKNPSVVDTSEKRVDDLDISQGITIVAPSHMDQVWKFPVTAKMCCVRKDGRDVFFKVSGQPVWDANNSGVDRNIDGTLWILWQENGKTYGGHYDWCRPHDTFKNYHTIRDPSEHYFTRFPPKGTTWYHLKTNNPKCPKRERTNVVRSDDKW